jgi:hypothetical protein
MQLTIIAYLAAVTDNRKRADFDALPKLCAR